ncbi:MAG: hypothetical protein FD153_1244 [Rhodospirillaceae bacterium]|nr:MAG: hypothetical protein FD153_1244 [Rhodospirillaceae bacterium]
MIQLADSSRTRGLFARVKPEALAVSSWSGRVLSVYQPDGTRSIRPW